MDMFKDNIIPLTEAGIEIEKVRKSNMTAKEKNREYARLRRKNQRQQIEQRMLIMIAMRERKSE